jgi:hypothetical protein
MMGARRQLRPARKQWRKVAGWTPAPVGEPWQLALGTSVNGMARREEDASGRVALQTGDCRAGQRQRRATRRWECRAQ